jgi:hypothetical protein
MSERRAFIAVPEPDVADPAAVAALAGDGDAVRPVWLNELGG